MDTKWKKFSRRIPVRVVLNVLLIASIILGGIVVDHIAGLAMKADELRSKVYANEDLCGNEQLVEEVQNNLQEALNYTLQKVCLEENNNNKEFLAKTKKELDEQCKNYNYRISFTGANGKETVITNTEDSEEKIAENPLYINYKGIKTDKGYVKEWKNQYKEDSTEFYWLEVNRLINENCYHNAKYAAFIANQLQKNLSLYKNDLKSPFSWLPSKEYKDIMEKIYGENFYDENDEYYDEDEDAYYDEEYEEYFEENEYHNAENVTSDYNEEVTNGKSTTTSDKNNPYGLTEAEQKKLESIMETTIFAGKDSEEKQIIVPIAAMLGSPEEYSISFGMKQSYYDEVQAVYDKEAKDNQKRALNFDKECEKNIYIFLYVCALFGVIVLALFYVCGRKYGTEEVQYLVIDRWYTELQILIEGIFYLGVISYTGFISSDMNDAGKALERSAYLIIPCMSVWLMVQFLCSFIRKAKGKKLYENSILCKIVNGIRNVMNSGKGTLITVVLAVVLPGVWGIISLHGAESLYEGDDSFFVFTMLLYLIGWGALVIFIYRFSSMFEKICDGVKRVKAGDIKYQIPTNGKKTRLNELAENINSLSDGLENAVNEMTKSERLKTELISNVSHDIKTPLTSIITYVDLIKKEDVQPEKAKEYIEVLDQKSQRLKALTDDLFEAAKASSGAMSMTVETLDVGAFISQGIGEFTEKFEKSNLDVKSNVEKETHFVKADGRLLWRIFENILANVSKYALPGSRVYVDVRKQEGNIILTVKNISAVELNISADELMERFTRGDSSRNTEGSGLGLNIAKSLAELQGGSFHVEIDGDLFKSGLALPETDRK